MKIPFKINNFDPAFTTTNGMAFCGDSSSFMKDIPNESIDLIVTSPPFALLKKKKYGNESSQDYVDWFITNFAVEFMRILKPQGSLVIDIGGSWNKGRPTRSLYHFELLLRLCGPDIGFHLAQEFFWYNPAKMPSPAEWVTIKRIRVKDSINPVWWLSKTDNPKADNRKVLSPYKPSMKKLLKEGYNDGLRPSGHNVSDKWGINHQGSIPPNLIHYPNYDQDFINEYLADIFYDNMLEIGNTGSKDKYLKACKQLGIKAHPARFPQHLPSFFINFLTDPGDVVYDPFGGSCVTGYAAEELNRTWITSEINEEYVYASQFRFIDPPESEPENDKEKIFVEKTETIK